MKLSIPIPLFLTTIIGRTCSYFTNSTLSEKKAYNFNYLVIFAPFTLDKTTRQKAIFTDFSRKKLQQIPLVASSSRKKPPQSPLVAGSSRKKPPQSSLVAGSSRKKPPQISLITRSSRKNHLC
jgi:hypothetical protein